MKKFSICCTALSTAALLIASLTGQAQSKQDGLLEGKLSSIAFYKYEKEYPYGDTPASLAEVFEFAEVSVDIDLSRVLMDHHAKDTRHDKKNMQIRVTITPHKNKGPENKGPGKLTFSGIVGKNGSYRAEAESTDKDGHISKHSIAGKVPDFLDALLSSNGSSSNRVWEGNFSGLHRSERLQDTL